MGAKMGRERERAGDGWELLENFTLCVHLYHISVREKTLEKT